MNTTRTSNEKGKIDRDTLLGRALTRAIAARTKDEPCPPLEDIAALVDGKLDGKRRDDVMGHLAGCDTCYHVFLSAREMVGAERKRTRTPVYVFSGLAAAAVLLLALSVVLRQTGTDEKQMVVKRIETAEPTSVKPAVGEVRDESDQKGKMPEKKKEYLPTTVGGMAEIVARGIDAERLRKLTGEGERRTYGFAEARNAGARVFRLGVVSTDLEMSLQKGDRDSALRHISQLMFILNSFEDLQVSATTIDQAREQLEGDTSPVKVRGVTESIRNGLPKELHIHLDFGAWSESARIAAATGNSVFFRDGAVAYFRKNLPRNKGTADSLKALEAMAPLVQGKEITPEGFALLEKSISEIIHQK